MHLSRKVFHASGILIVGAYAWLGLERSIVVGGLWAVVALLLLVDLLRARFPAVQAAFGSAFGLLLQEKDARGLNGSTLYLGGCAVAITLYPLEPACAGVLALALGDPVAAIVGTSIRSPRVGRVSLAGSSACLVAASCGCALFVPWPEAIVGGAVAALLEACSGTKLDNFTIPIGVSTVLYLI